MGNTNNEMALAVVQPQAVALQRTPLLEPSNLQELQQLGTLMAQSGFFQDARQAAQACVKILAGREMGFPPIASMTGISVIDGKPATGATLLAAGMKRMGYSWQVLQRDAKGCRLEIHFRGQKLGPSEFLEEDAKRANLLSKSNWTKWPRSMYFARAISDAARTYAPEVFAGIPAYTAEELGAENTTEDGTLIIDATPVPPPPAHPPQASATAFPSSPTAAAAPTNGGGKREPAPASNTPIHPDPQVDPEVQALYEQCKKDGKWDRFKFISTAHDIKRGIEELCGNDVPYYEVLDGFQMKGFGPKDVEALTGTNGQKINKMCAVIKALHLKMRAIEASAFAEQGNADVPDGDGAESVVRPEPADDAAQRAAEAFAEEANNV